MYVCVCPDSQASKHLIKTEHSFKRAKILCYFQRVLSILTNFTHTYVTAQQMQLKVAKVVFFSQRILSLSFHFKLDLCNQLDLTVYKIYVNENNIILVHLYFYFYTPFHKAPSLGWK